MCIASPAATVTTLTTCIHVYRQHCSHCHPLATCTHMCIASTAATVTHLPRVSICVSPALQPLSPTGQVYSYVYRQHCSHSHPTDHVNPYVYRQNCSQCHPLATCTLMCIASTAATVTHLPRVSICVSPALQPLSPTCHVYPYVNRPHCSHCHPLATCIHVCFASTTATLTHWSSVSICVSPALQPLSPH